MRMVDAALMRSSYRIERARAVRIEDEIARRGITLRGGTDRCGPCPQCGGRDRFSINTKKQIFNCRGCSAGGDVIALVRHLGALITLLAGPAPERTVYSIAKQRDQAIKQPQEELQDGTQNLALDLWRAATDPRDTLVRCYLEHRKHDLPDEIAGEAIRFHPECPMAGERHPAMVCLVRDIVTNEPQAIHRTALTTEGRAVKRNGKTFRMSLGPVSGGAVKLDPDETVTQGICIGEGVETCLSGRQMGLRPVWSAVSTSGVASFPVLAGVGGLHIFKENDANCAGAKAVEACAGRWHEAGRDVVIVEAEVGKDLNDELRGRAA